MAGELRVKAYSSLDDLRRDLTYLWGDVEKSVKRLRSLKYIYASAIPGLARRACLAQRSSTTLDNMLTAAFTEEAVGESVRIRGRNSTIDVGPGTLTPIKTPEGLSDSFKEYRDLNQQIEMVENMHEQLTHDFESFKDTVAYKNALKNLVTLREAIQKELDKSGIALDKITTKNLPTKFKNLGTKVFDTLKTELKGRFTKNSAKIESRIAPVNDHLHFVTYMSFKNVEDDRKYTYPLLVVILTRKVDANDKFTDYLNLAGKKALPGTYRLYQPVHDAENAIEVLHHMMAAQHFSYVTEPKKLPFRRVDLKLVHDLISKTEIKGRTILVTFKTDDTAKAQDAANEMVRQLKHLAFKNSPRNKDLVTFQIQPAQAKKITVKFRFTPQPAEGTKILSPYDWTKLGDLFDMDESDIRRLQEALEGIDKHKLEPSVHVPKEGKT